MMTPKSLLRDKILIPLYDFQTKYLSRSALFKACNEVANLIFKKSDDMPFILLLFNSISIISSHFAQIRGLKKSDRENKDYLITQEYKEFGLDMLFTVIPPFMLKNFLEKKFYSGQWTTKSAREHLLYTITPTVGAAKEELYNISHIKPMKETAGAWIAQLNKYLKKVPNLPASVKKIINLVEQNPNVRLPDQNQAIPMATMKQIAVDFDNIRKNKFKGFYNGSAYDEIIGQYEGMIIIATLAYTILASSVITPILKNKLANKTYDKQFENTKKHKVSILNRILPQKKEKPQSDKYKIDLYSLDNESVFSDMRNIACNKTVNTGFSQINNIKNQNYGVSSLKI